MTKNYILAIFTSHPNSEALGMYAARLFTEAGFVLTVLRGVKMTALDFEKEDQIFSNAMFILWGKGSGLELEHPQAMVMQAEKEWRQDALGSEERP